MHEYVKKAEISFDDFELFGSGYLKRIICDEDTVIVDINSKLYRERIGTGHLYTSGDWKLEDTRPVNYIHIYKKE